MREFQAGTEDWKEDVLLETELTEAQDKITLLEQELEEMKTYKTEKEKELKMHRKKISGYVSMLDELYDLVLIEEENVLTEDQSKRYVILVETLKGNDVHIPFGIVL